MAGFTVNLEPLEPRLLLSGVDVDAGYSFLDEQFQQYEQAVVYSDVDAGGNLFAPSGFLNAVPPLLATDPAWTDDVHEGTTCMRIDWQGGASWAALAFEWPPGATSGQDGLGWDLDSATQLTFWARTPTGETTIEFGVGDNGLDGFQVRQDKEVGAGWTQYTIPVSAEDLSNLHLGFLVAFGAEAATIYIDDVRFDCPCPEPLQLVQSYRPDPVIGLLADKTVYRNTAFTYDSSALALTYMARGSLDDMAKATGLMETFDWILRHEDFEEDPGFEQYLGANQAFVHSTYCSGPIRYPGEDQPRPGFWNDSGGWHRTSREASVGVNAWLMLALLDYSDRTGEVRYLNDAVMIGNWIHGNFHDNIFGGYTLGLLEEDGQLTKSAGFPKSTEHNVDCYAAFSRLADALTTAHNPGAAKVWQKRARDAGDFVLRMFGKAEGRFYAGTLSDGVTPDTTAYALDTQSWPVLTLSTVSRYRRKIDWARPLRWAETQLGSKSSAIPGQVVEGFDFGKYAGEDPDGAWTEGSAHMAAAYGSTGEIGKTEEYLDYLGIVQEQHPHGDGQGLVAAMEDGLTTVFGDNEYNARLHVGATAWTLLAAQGDNPFDSTHAIELTSIPSYGSKGKLKGRVQGVSSQSHYLGVYVFAGGGWYTKPTYAKPYTRIGRGGKWSCPIVTGGVDHLASQIAVFLVPVGSLAPLLTGESHLPSDLYDMSRGWIVRERIPDLLGTIGDGNWPTPTNPGDKGKVTLQLANDGFAMTGARATLAVYASLNDTLNPLEDVLLGTKAVTRISLASQGAHNYRVRITLPPDLPLGRYRILAAIDVFNSVAESDEDNNVIPGDLWLEVS